MPRANPQQNKKYYSCDPRQTHGDFHNKIGQERISRLHAALWLKGGNPHKTLCNAIVVQFF